MKSFLAANGAIKTTLSLVFATNCIMLSLGTVQCQLADFTVIDMLKDVQGFHGFESVVILKNQNSIVASSFQMPQVEIQNVTGDQDQFVAQIMQQLQVPVLQLNEKVSYFLNAQFDDSFMVVVCWEGEWGDHVMLLQKLAQNLKHITSSKILFLINEDSVNEELLVRLFQYCWEMRMLNVIALFSNYQTSASFYGYDPFPSFQLEEKTIHVDANARISPYPNRMKDLKGFKVPVIIGGSDPRFVAYKKATGDLYIGGFAGHLMLAMVQWLNSSYREPIPVNLKTLPAAVQMLTAVRNGTVEFSIGMTFPSIPMEGYTYPYEQMNWCMMLPMEQDVPYYDFFIYVFEPSAFGMIMAAIIVISMFLTLTLFRHHYKVDILHFLIHDNMLRGVLGQSFSEVLNPPLLVRFIYLQICIFGIVLTTTFNAYFSTYVTSSPKQAPLRTYADVAQSGLKIITWGPEYMELRSRVPLFKTFEKMFYVEPEFNQYLAKRDSFNTKFGYLMPTTKWGLIQEQQKIFTRPLFRMRDDFCFFNNIPMTFPIHENSIYGQPLHSLMLMTHQSGLFNYWFKNSFLELIAAGRMKFVDLTPKKQYVEMVPQDFKYVWYGFAVMGVLTTLVFLGEILWFHRFRISNGVRQMFLNLCCRRIRNEV